MVSTVLDPGGGRGHHLGTANSLEELKGLYLSLGGDESLFDNLVRAPFLGAEDKKWLSVDDDGYQERLDKVPQVLPIEGLVEVEVVNSQGENTGRAFAQICGHKHSRGNDTFEIWHLVSSDEDYNMHLCRKLNEKGECTHRPQQAKRTGLMHVKTWRPVSFECMLNQEYSYCVGLKHLGWVLEQKLKDVEIRAADAALAAEFPNQDIEPGGAPEDERKKAPVQSATSKSAPQKRAEGDEQKAARMAAWDAALSMHQKEPALINLGGQKFGQQGEPKGDLPLDPRRERRRSEARYGERPLVRGHGPSRFERDWKDDISALGEAGEPSFSGQPMARERSRTPKKDEKKSGDRRGDRYMPLVRVGKEAEPLTRGGRKRRPEGMARGLVVTRRKRCEVQRLCHPGGERRRRREAVTRVPHQAVVGERRRKIGRRKKRSSRMTRRSVRRGRGLLVRAVRPPTVMRTFMAGSPESSPRFWKRHRSTQESSLGAGWSKWGGTWPPVLVMGLGGVPVGATRK